MTMASVVLPMSGTVDDGDLRDIHGRAHAARPVAFCGMAGIFTPAPAAGGIAVLFVSPWGLEDLCVRKFWRVIAGHLAERNVASLRFDLPGTGDSLDPASCGCGLRLWEDAVVQAAGELMLRSGAARIVLVGQGLGAALAVRVSARLDALGGMALLAPVVSGRFYLREVSAMARMVDDSLGLAEDQRRTEGVSIAGFTMPEAIAADVKRLDLMAVNALPAVPCLVAGRAPRPADGALADRFTTLGVSVERLAFEGYEALTANPSVSIIPENIAVRLADWIVGLAPGSATAAVKAPLPGGVLEGGTFIEEPVRFGREMPLYGVLCAPAGPRAGATVLFLSTGYDRHAGWGRATVTMARQLAARGIASLRFDGANVADSPPVPDAPQQVLYGAGQEEDVAAALDFLMQRELGPVVLGGRCSGAYLSFRAAVADPRVSGAVIVNPYTFHWQPGRDVDAALQTGARALSDYGQRALQWATVRRLFKGEIDVRRAFANIVKAASRKALAPFMLSLRHYTQEGRHVHTAFRALRKRSSEVTLVYSENDVGWEHFSSYFGKRGERLKDYPDVRLVVISNADHNLTPPHARKAYLDAVEQMALRFASRG
ncbi:alpha/beta fold hydrolase [Rhizobiaceae bacterium BDR2-2]|uniref:Alpha/beta fold hydrolase n=1 Tax=Ectorhizobium quercum TaxID=2965071 RepID=A0AAE3SYK0_9HYPH|nr:alpha/beta fold hydrolase [Ectorhizobium quercum]MCX8999625.1 alpha/beta fold hydrolase [Ectorhizobium quercum]